MMKKHVKPVSILMTFAVLLCSVAGAAAEWGQQELNIQHHDRTVWDLVKDAAYAKNYEPAPDITDRDFWDNLPEEVSAELIKNGEAQLSPEWSVLLASDYMIFDRTGDRNEFQNKYFQRRSALTALVLAECVENEGRFMDDIIDGIFLIMEEGTWCLPAHNVYIRDTDEFPLPDFTRPIVDLFAAETGALLAMTEYLLHPSLMEVHEFVVKDINQRLQERIFTPYLSYHFWWMGDGVSHMLNWTPWITHNVMLAAFTRSDEVLPVSEKSKILEQAAISTDFFLDEYEEDGCCDEGPSYYGNAALRNYFLLEVMNEVTDGATQELFSESKISNMGSYIVRMHIGGGYYFNYGDASPRLGGRGMREYLYGKATGSDELMNFAATDVQKNMSVGGGREPYFSLVNIMAWDEVKNYETGPIIPKDYYFDSQQLMVARDSSFVLGLKGGNNGVAHNHNDVGSFIIYKDGQPMFIDLGSGTYTDQTFNPDGRYEIFYMQSGYHNLPTIDGFVQFGGDGAGTGTEYAAKDVTYVMEDGRASIRMDIADAFRHADDGIGVKIGDDGKLVRMEGADAIRSYYRTATLVKEDRIIIEDEFDGDLPVVVSLMVAQEPTVMETDAGFSVTIGDLGTCDIAGAESVEAETIVLEDASLARSWGERVYRILIHMDSGNKLTMEVR